MEASVLVPWGHIAKDKLKKKQPKKGKVLCERLDVDGDQKTREKK
jgi:hypothetical protein